MGEKLGEKVGEKTGEKVGESLGEIHKLNLCLFLLKYNIFLQFRTFFDKKKNLGRRPKPSGGSRSRPA